MFAFLQKIVDYFKPKDYDVLLIDSVKNLQEDSPTVATWMNSIITGKERTLHIIRETLPGDVEATTTVSEYDDPVIKVDVFKVLSKHDRLEPVIGHEVSHVYDAYYKYGITNFCQIVAREAQLPWEQRTVEKWAIALENVLRLQLLTNNPKRYKGMPRTREQQNQQANACR